LSHKVNVQARIKRHSRIIKDSILAKWTKQIASDYSYKIMLFIIIFIVPIYPTIASLFQKNSVVDFYRWNIDESSIIWSYYWWSNSDTNLPLWESYEDSFLSINTILNDDRDLSWTNEIIKYIIKNWDNISSIAYKFRVSNNSIYWANDFSKTHIIHPWDVIKIPPVSWLIHQISKWDTLISIAKKYKVEINTIIKQNLIRSWDKLVAWEILVVPWAIKKKPNRVYKRAPVRYASRNRSNLKKIVTPYVNIAWRFKLKWRRPYSWAWWNCTYYVASYKNVDWRGNANRWLRNARAKWHKTWHTPRVGSIVSFEGRWYNPRYWHVAIVMDVKKDYIVVSEMNYRRINEVTYRKVNLNDRRITGYIYVWE